MYYILASSTVLASSLEVGPEAYWLSPDYQLLEITNITSTTDGWLLLQWSATTVANTHIIYISDIAVFGMCHIHVSFVITIVKVVRHPSDQRYSIQTTNSLTILAHKIKTLHSKKQQTACFIREKPQQSQLPITCFIPPL